MATQLTGYPELNRAEFMAAMAPHFTRKEMDQIEAAYFFSKYAHRGQWRDNGVIRYFDHPRAVAWILFSELHIHDWEIIVAALLHDMIEDSYIMTESRLELNFGREVTLSVRYMSHDDSLNDVKYWQRFHEVESWRATVCKLADRLHNLRTLHDVTIEKQVRKLVETREAIFPLFEVAIELTPECYKASVVKLTEMIEDMVDDLEEGLEV